MVTLILAEQGHHIRDRRHSVGACRREHFSRFARLAVGCGQASRALDHARISGEVPVLYRGAGVCLCHTL